MFQSVGLEKSIIFVSSSASRFEIDLSTESFLLVEIHMLASFNVAVIVLIFSLSFDGTNI